MNVSGKLTDGRDWKSILKQTVDDEQVICRITAENKEAQPYPCDGCGKEVKTLYVENAEPVLGIPLKKHDYFCGDCK